MKVLDHGFVELVESWGSDEAIISAARMSTGKGFLGWGPMCGRCGKPFDPKAKVSCGEGCQGGASEVRPGDEKLLRFLYENKHSTPFEMAGMTIEVQAPIFVFREWHRHRTQSYAEMSSRYTPLPDFAYVPTVERCLVNSKTNKQAGTIKGADELTENEATALLKEERVLLERIEDLYQRKLRCGFPKELARTHLSVSRYSRMRASTDLRNWLGFLTLRLALGAQYEVRMYAEAVESIVAEKFPRTWALFKEGLK